APSNHYTTALHYALPISEADWIKAAAKALLGGAGHHDLSILAPFDDQRSAGQRHRGAPVDLAAPHGRDGCGAGACAAGVGQPRRSEEHTSELKSREYLVW